MGGTEINYNPAVPRLGVHGTEAIVRRGRRFDPFIFVPLKPRDQLLLELMQCLGRMIEEFLRHHSLRAEPQRYLEVNVSEPAANREPDGNDGHHDQQRS